MSEQRARTSKGLRCDSYVDLSALGLIGAKRCTRYHNHTEDHVWIESLTVSGRQPQVIFWKDDRSMVYELHPHVVTNG